MLVPQIVDANIITCKWVSDKINFCMFNSIFFNNFKKKFMSLLCMLSCFDEIIVFIISYHR